MGSGSEIPAVRFLHLQCDSTEPRRMRREGSFAGRRQNGQQNGGNITPNL